MSDDELPRPGDMADLARHAATLFILFPLALWVIALAIGRPWAIEMLWW